MIYLQERYKKVARRVRQVTRPAVGSAGLIAGYETPDARPAGTENQRSTNWGGECFCSEALQKRRWIIVEGHTFGWRKWRLDWLLDERRTQKVMERESCQVANQLDLQGLTAATRSTILVRAILGLNGGTSIGQGFYSRLTAS